MGLPGGKWGIWRVLRDAVPSASVSKWWNTGCLQHSLRQIPAETGSSGGHWAEQRSPGCQPWCIGQPGRKLLSSFVAGRIPLANNGEDRGTKTLLYVPEGPVPNIGHAAGTERQRNSSACRWCSCQYFAAVSKLGEGPHQQKMRNFYWFHFKTYYFFPFLLFHLGALFLPALFLPALLCMVVFCFNPSHFCIWWCLGLVSKDVFFDAVFDSFGYNSCQGIRGLTLFVFADAWGCLPRCGCMARLRFHEGMGPAPYGQHISNVVFTYGCVVTFLLELCRGRDTGPGRSPGSTLGPVPGKIKQAAAKSRTRHSSSFCFRLTFLISFFILISCFIMLLLLPGPFDEFFNRFGNNFCL